MKIKHWSEFQHFKDRTPPWIKLYRHLLDDPEGHELSGDDAKTLIMLWLIASEDKDMQGTLPSIKNTAFRLRISEGKLNQSLTKLSHWLIQDDIKAISSGYQHDAPETETETEGEQNADKKSATQSPTKVDLTGIALLKDINQDVAKQYIKVRGKKTLTALAVARIEMEAEKAGLTLEQAIVMCCENSWTGFNSQWEAVKSKVKPKEENWFQKAQREGKVL